MVFRIFTENIGLALSQTLPKSGNIPPSSLVEETPVEVRISTVVTTSDIKTNASETLNIRNDVSSISESVSSTEPPAIESDKETKALHILKNAIESLADLGLDTKVIQNQFRQALSALKQSIENGRFAKVELQVGEELDQSVKTTRQQILTESTKVITGHSNLNREGVLDLLK